MVWDKNLQALWECM